MAVLIEMVFEFFEPGGEQRELPLEGRNQSKQRVGSLVVDCLEVGVFQHN